MPEAEVLFAGKWWEIWIEGSLEHKTRTRRDAVDAAIHFVGTRGGGQVSLIDGPDSTRIPVKPPRG